MAARRLIVIMLVLLVLSSITAALVPQTSRESEPDPAATTMKTVPVPGQGKLIERTLATARQAPARIRIDLGDQVLLRVTAPRPVQVSIPRVGELADADPDAPAHFDLFPTQPGTYEVRLVGGDRTIGRIEVTETPELDRADLRSAEDQPGAAGGEAGPPSA